MRLVFISSVTAMTPLRTISVTTGSTLRVARGLRATVFVLFAMAPLPASRHFDHQMSAGVDFEPVAGEQHGRRGVFLDQRRPADPVAGSERRAGVGWRRAELAVQVDRPSAGEGGLVGRAFSARDPFLRRLAHDARAGAAQAPDLRTLV